MKSPTFQDYTSFQNKHRHQASLVIQPKPLVSYITVCFNRAHSLRKTIESVLSQTDRDFEYIVIDGGSTDGSLEILKTYASRLSVLVSEKDSGIYDAFNRGISLSRGQWINIVNSDDWIDSNTLSLFRQQLSQQQQNAEIICGQTRFWNPDGTGYLFDASPKLLKQESTIGHNAAYVKRQVHEEIGLYRTDLKLASDYDFFLKCMVAGKVFQTAAVPLVNMSSDGASDRNWVRLYKEIASVQKEVLGLGTRADLMLGKRLLRTGVSRQLSKMGLEPLVSLYRRYLSPLKKTRL